MASKHMRRCSILLVISELKFQWDTVTHSLKQPTPQNKQTNKKQTIANTSKDMEQQEFLFIAGENEKWYQYLRRQFGSFLQNYLKSNVVLSYDPVIMLLDTYSVMSTQKKLAWECLQ